MKSLGASRTKQSGWETAFVLKLHRCFSAVRDLVVCVPLNVNMENLQDAFAKHGLHGSDSSLSLAQSDSYNHAYHEVPETMHFQALKMKIEHRPCEVWETGQTVGY